MPQIEYLGELEPLKKQEPTLSLDETNKKRKEYLDAGYSNKEIDEHFGVPHMPEGWDRFGTALKNTVDYFGTVIPETAASIVSGAGAWVISKTAGAIIGLEEGTRTGDFEKGTETGRKIEEKIAQLLTYAPKNPQAKDTVETIGYILDKTVGGFGREAGDMTADIFRHSKLAPWLRYITEFGTELAVFAKAPKVIKKGVEKAETILTPKEKADIITEHILKDESPQDAITKKAVDEYTSSYSDAKPEEFFSKSAEESLRTIEVQTAIGERKITPEIKPTEPLKAEEPILTPPPTVEPTKPSGAVELPLGAEKEALKGKIPSVETPITPLEKAAEGAKVRAIEAEMAEKQLGIPIEEGKMPLEERVSKLETAGYPEAAKKLREHMPQNVITWIKSKGGIDYIKEFWTGELDIAMETQPSLKGAINKKGGGLTLDELSMRAKAEGWLDEATPQALLNAIEIKKTNPNRIISQESYNKAYREFTEKTTGLHMGVDPTALKDMVVIGAYHLETGIRNIAHWSELMVKQFGEEIKPHLDEIWEKSHRYFKEELIDKTRERLVAERQRPRKFLQTVAESEVTSPELKGKVKEIEPQEYITQPNAESMAKAETRISKSIEEAEKYVKGTEPIGAEKGATFVSLIKDAQDKGMYDKAIDLIDTYDTQLREAGRFVQAASIWNRLTPEGFMKWAEREIEKINAKKGILDAIFGNKKVSLTKEEKAYILKEKNRIDAMPEGVEKTNANIALVDTIAKKVPPTISEMIDAFRYQNMLSGWQTQERNIGGNIVNTVITRPAVLASKGMIDYVEASLFGKERQAYVSDVPLAYKHIINAVPNALESFKAAWYMTDPTMLKPELGVQYKTPFEQARARQLPKALTVIQRLMEASDKFNITLISSAEYGINLKAGKTHEQSLSMAKDIAEKYLYRNKWNLDELSAFAKIPAILSNLMTELRHQPVIGKLSSWIVPFIRTPMNIGTLSIEISPLGILRTKGFTPEIKARVATGSVITALGAIFALNNQTTWVAPSDPESKKIYYATGRKPFSVKIGDNWIPMWYLGPFMTAFAIPAAVKYYTTEQKKVLSDNQFEQLIDIAGGMARFIGSQTSAQSIGAFFNVLSGDVSYSFPGQLGFTSGQVIPLSGLLRNVNKILDPVYRDPKGFWEAIQKDMPFLSKDIPVHTTPEGEEAKRQWWNAMLPYEFGKEDKYYNDFYDSIIKAKQIQSLGNELNIKAERGKLTEKDLEEFQEKLNEAYSQE